MPQIFSVIAFKKPSKIDYYLLCKESLDHLVSHLQTQEQRETKVKDDKLSDVANSSLAKAVDKMKYYNIKACYEPCQKYGLQESYLDIKGAERYPLGALFRDLNSKVKKIYKRRLCPKSHTT